MMDLLAMFWIAVIAFGVALIEDKVMGRTK